MWFVLILFGITGVVWTLNRFWPFTVCPVCAGVSGTWFLLTALALAGYADMEMVRPLVLLLMGGTVVGVAYQGERSWKRAARFPLAWKASVIGAGMPLAFWAAQHASAGVLTAEAVALVMLAYIFFVRRPEGRGSASGAERARVRSLEEKLKGCC